MELDRAGAQEHRPADFGVGPALGDEQGDLQFLGGQLLASVPGAGYGLTAGPELGLGPFGPGAGVEPAEDLSGGAQLDPRVAAPAGAAQPLSIAQQRPSMLEHQIAALVESDRLQEMSIKVVGDDAPAPGHAGG